MEFIRNVTREQTTHYYVCDQYHDDYTQDIVNIEEEHLINVLCVEKYEYSRNLKKLLTCCSI